MPLPAQPTAEIIDHYLHGLLDGAEAAELERRTADEPSWATALAAGKRRRAVLEAALPPTEPAGELAAHTVRAVLGAERKRRKRRYRGWLGTVAGFAIAAGLLLTVQWAVTNAPTPHVNLEVLGQTAFLADAPASLRVRLTDSKTQKPLRNKSVNISFGPMGPGMFTKAFFDTTDRFGTVQVSFRTPDWAPGRYKLYVQADTDEGKRGVEMLSQDITIKRDTRLMLSTDKPAYQPGQTVHARGLALRRPDLKPAANEPTTFTLTDPKGNVLFKQEKPTSRFGIAATDCPLAAELAEGQYQLTCRIGTVESHTAVDVRKYVLPKFKLDVTFDKTFYKPNDLVKGSINGAYFFGQPVADGTVTMEVRADDSRQTVIDKRQVKTGPDGKVDFEFQLPKQFAGRPQDQRDARFTLTAILRDTAGQETGKTVSRLVTNQELHIEVIPESTPLIPEIDNYVYVYVSTPDGKPVVSDVAVRFGSDTFTATTNDAGVGRVTVRMRVNGLERLINNDTDPNAPQTAFEMPPQLVVKATSKQGQTATVRSHQNWATKGLFVVRTDKAVYEAGQSLEVTVVGHGQQPVFVDLIRDGQTIRTDTVDLQDGRGILAFDIPVDYAGTLQLCAYRFNGDGTSVRKLRTLVIKPAEGLRVKLAADKPEYRPGEQAKLKFTLTDTAGKPAPGALSLAAVDEAVYAVLQQRPGLEQAFYLLEQELLKPVATLYPWEPDLPLPPRDRDLLEMALFASTARTIEPNREVGSDNSVVNPYTLNLTSLPEKIKEFEILKHTRLDRIMHFWMGLGIFALIVGWIALCQMIGTIRVVVVTVILVIASGLLMFTQVGERAMQQAGIMKTAEMKSDMAMPSAMERGFPPSEAKGGRDAEQSSEPLRVRDRFPETLLWQPELITDDDGHAELTVPLADSITTWRLCASAVSASGKLGALQAGVRVFQPFFVDLDLPVALTRNDSVAVPVVVSNFLDTPQTVTVTLADVPWCERTGPATQTLELPPRAVRSVHFPIKVIKAGQYQLEVTARGQGVGDAVRRSIEVIPDGRLVEQVISGTLDRPATLNVTLQADTIPDSAKLFVRIYPSAFSQLLDGLDAIFQMPYGCFEQTSSTTYPNILALDYLKRTGQAKPDVEAKARQFITLGYQRLVQFEVPGGGFDWFGHAPADVSLTAYGLMEFQDMSRVHDVDPNLILRTRSWLIKQRAGDGSWQAGRFHIGGDAQLAATAYVARAVFHGDDDLQAGPTRDYLLRRPPESIGDPYTLALVIGALQATKADASAVDKYVEQLLARKQSSEDGKQVYWEMPVDARTAFYGARQGGNIEATAIAALTLLKTEREPAVVRGALSWLVAQKDPRGTWHSTQATVLALQALTAGTTGKLGGDRERRFVVKAGNHSQELLVPVNQADVVQRLDLTPHLKSGVTNLTVEETTGTGSGFQIITRHHVPGAAPPPAVSVLAVDLQYDSTRTTVGSDLRATATLRNTGDKVAPMVMLDLPIPGGFAVEAEDFNTLVRLKQIEKFQVTPRQVIVYLRALEAGRSLEVKYRLKATMPVEVSADAARAYEYYDPDRKAAGGATKLVAAEN